MKKLLNLLFLLLLIPASASAQLRVSQGGTGITNIPSGSIPFGSTTLYLATSSALNFNNAGSRLTVTNASTTNLSATTFCLTGDICRTTWPSGGGGGGNIATGTTAVAGQLLYWQDTNTTPAHIGNDSNLRWDGGTLAVVGSISAGDVNTGTLSTGVFNSLPATDAFGTFYATSTPTVARYISTSTSNASLFPYASSTAVTATTLCLTGDTCRTTWPSSGAGVWPFTPSTNFATAVQATTTPEWFQNGLHASSTNQFLNSNIWGTMSLKLLGTPAGSILAVDPSGNIIATTTSTGGVASVNGTYPVQSTGGANPSISLAFGTTTSNTWAGTQTFNNSTTSLATILNGLYIGNSGLTTIYGDSATSTFSGNIEAAGGSTGQVDIGAAADFTNLAANNAGILRTAGTGAFPFDQGGSLVLAPRSASTAGRGSLYFYSGLRSLNMRLDENGRLGIGTSTPTNRLEVGGNTFLGGNLTATGTVKFTGLTGLSCLGTDANGVVGSGTCTGGSGAWPFTPSTNFGTAVQATTTPEWFQNGLQASSTNQFVNSNIWGNLRLMATSSALLATDASGNVIATSSIGTNFLTGTLATINGTAITAGGSATITAATTSLSNNNTWTGQNQFWGGFSAGIASSTSQASIITVDWNGSNANHAGNEWRQILTQNTSLILNATSSNPIDGGKYILKLCQDGVGSRTVTWATPGQLIWSNGTTTISSGANTGTVIGMIYDGRTSRYDIVASSTISDTRTCLP